MGPTAAVEVNTEFTFSLAASVAQGSVSSMVLTDTMDAATGITFLRVSPDAGAHCGEVCGFFVMAVVAGSSKLAVVLLYWCGLAWLNACHLQPKFGAVSS